MQEDIGENDSSDSSDDDNQFLAALSGSDDKTRSDEGQKVAAKEQKPPQRTCKWRKSEFPQRNIAFKNVFPEQLETSLQYTGKKPIYKYKNIRNENFHRDAYLNG